MAIKALTPLFLLIQQVVILERQPKMGISGYPQCHNVIQVITRVSTSVEIVTEHHYPIQRDDTY